MSEEKNRFSVLKENTFKKKSTKNNFKKKDEKSSSNGFQKQSNNRNKFRRTKRQYNSNQEVKPVIGKFRQVGVGEVSFVPQVKKSKQEKKKKEKKLVPFKKEEEESAMDEDDIALTLALAEKYQYITESEEEEEAYEDDYAEEEEIHHLDGQTIEEAEHQIATRLYQNNARVHFNQHIEKSGRFGKRIIYGGYIISLARAISCNGLANTFKLAAIHSGKHSAPTFAGDTIYAWSKILEKEIIHKNVGAMMIRTLASKNDSKMNFPDKKNLPDNIVLDLEYSVLIPIK